MTRWVNQGTDRSGYEQYYYHLDRADCGFLNIFRFPGIVPGSWAQVYKSGVWYLHVPGGNCEPLSEEHLTVEEAQAMAIAAYRMGS